MSSHAFLLDANVLLALFWPTHLHHGAVHRWFRRNGFESWATCQTVQLAFIRLSSNSKIFRDAKSPKEAHSALRTFLANSNHRFLPDTRPVVQDDLFQKAALFGHKQVTDLYLLSLAITHSAKLATCDKTIPELLAITDAKLKDHLEIVPV